MLDARGITTANNLIAQVQGEIADVDGVLRITRIDLTFELNISNDQQTVIDRALRRFSANCPAYQSVKGCIDCNWQAKITS